MTVRNATNNGDQATYCIGRFLIDLPPGSTISGGNFEYDFIAIEPVKAQTAEAFQNEVGGRERALKSKTNSVSNGSMFLSAESPNAGTRIITSWEGEFSDVLLAIEGYRLVDGNRFLFRDSVGKTKLDLGMESMRDALSRVRPRSDEDIPSSGGYCFNGGFIANPRWRNEHAGVDFDIAGHPDAFVSVEIHPRAWNRRDKPLLERMGGVTQAIGALVSSVHVLRKGDRRVADFDGQEYLSTAPNSGGMRGHLFMWETQGKGTVKTPAIRIELTTGHQDPRGNPQKTTFTDEQAIKLWDQLLDSFRVRPVDDVKEAKPSAKLEPLAPIGELVATGGTCPQTGWWEPSETVGLTGARRQRFVAGEKLPDVTLIGAPTVWQKIKGETPSYRTATVWRLAAYDEPEGDNANS